jgi:hypothetical protein
MKKLMILLLCLFPILCFGQATKKQLVMIRVTEVAKGCMQSQMSLIHITETDGSYRVIQLESHALQKYLYLAEGNKNQKIIHDVLEEYLNKGFSLESHVTTKYTGCAMLDTFVLIKME